MSNFAWWYPVLPITVSAFLVWQHFAQRRWFFRLVKYWAKTKEAPSQIGEEVNSFTAAHNLFVYPEAALSVQIGGSDFVLVYGVASSYHSGGRTYGCSWHKCVVAISSDRAATDYATSRADLFAPACAEQDRGVFWLKSRSRLAKELRGNQHGRK